MVRLTWEANFLRVEGAIALVLSGGVIAWSELFGGADCLDSFLADNAVDLYTVLAPINAALLGFIMAAAAIMVTAAPAKRMALLRDSQHYGDLWACFRGAMRYAGIGTLTTAAGLVVTGVTAGRLVFYLCLVVGLLAVFRIARAIWAVNWVIRIFTAPPLRRGPHDD